MMRFKLLSYFSALLLCATAVGCGGNNDNSNTTSSGTAGDTGGDTGGTTSVCGNGTVEAGEACDDGNVVKGDGCDASCQVEPNPCGNGVLDPGEACDDGNQNDADACSNACQVRSAVQGLLSNDSISWIPANGTITSLQAGTSKQQLFLAGSFQGTLNLGWPSDLNSAGADDIFLVKLEDNSIVSQRQFGDAADQKLRVLKVDPNGEIVVAGTYLGTPDLGNGAPLPLPDGTEPNLFIAKYADDLSLVWAKGFGNGASQLTVADLAIDADGRIAITGSFAKKLNFGKDDMNSATESKTDAYFAIFGSNGDTFLSHRLGDAGDDDGIEIEFDNSGNIILAGIFTNQIQLGSALDSLQVAPKEPGLDEQTAIFIAQFEAETGTYVWGNRIYGSPSNSFSSVLGDLKIDGEGSPILAGSFLPFINFGEGEISATTTNLFLARYTGKEGALVWAKTSESKNNAHFGEILIGSQDKILTLGQFAAGALSFGPYWLDPQIERGLFLLGFGNDGSFAGGDVYGQVDPSLLGLIEAENLLADSEGNFILVARSNVALDLEGAVLGTTTAKDNPSKYSNILIVKLKP